MSTDRQNEATSSEKQPPKLAAVNAPSGTKVGGGGQAQTAQKPMATTSTPIRSIGKRASRGNARKSLFSSSSSDEDGEETGIFARHPPPQVKGKEKQQQKPEEKERRIEATRAPNKQQLGGSTAIMPAKQENREVSLL
jgi:hypothetical protein